MENDNTKNSEGVYSKKIRAGRRRTYFFDVRTTRSGDYFLTITESKKRFNEDGYDRHKIFLYKEDFNKFLEAIGDTINHVKKELMPNYNFDEFSHKDHEDHEGEHSHDHSHSHDGEQNHDHEDHEDAGGNHEMDGAPAEEKEKTSSGAASSDDDLKW